MTDNEEGLSTTGVINRSYLESLAFNLQSPYPDAELPIRNGVLNAIITNENNEVESAKKSKGYIGLTDDELPIAVEGFIDSYISEMRQYEQVARQDPRERLKKLKEIAPTIKRVVIRSAPGSYKRAFKEDKYKHIPAMRSADRLRDDQAVMLTAVLAGIQLGWEDEDLLLLLQTHVLLDTNPSIDHLKEKVHEAISETGIRIVYTGIDDEIEPIQRLLEHDKNIWIPNASVDILPLGETGNSLGQTEKLKHYLENLHTGEGFIEVTNIQGMRSGRMDAKHNLIPDGCKGYQFIMPTGGEGEIMYRTGETKGALFYWLAGHASFEPANYQLI